MWTDQIKEIWRKDSLGTDDQYARACLKRLNTLLSGDTPPFHTFRYVANQQAYILVTKIAVSAHDVDILDESARFFNTLIDGEVEGILDSRIFARALIDIVRQASRRGLGDYEEGNLVELLFAVANRIRLDPTLLHAWFYPERTAAGAEKSGDGIRFAGTTRKDDFPIFYVLTDYVHHDGRVGDFARTGLLYLIDTASKSRSLEKWMIESDLATLMATGLGALYSRLSRRLPSGPRQDQIPPILALSDFELPAHHETDADLASFMGYLLFWQDTLYHCASREVMDTLLDHFQILFLQQLLYPSLLESSDMYGGSTASVITYLYRILDVIDHPELSQRILRYLFASQASQASVQPKADPKMSMSRRKSLDILAAFSKAEDNPSPELFNLADLIGMSLRSRRPLTISATLKLLSVILRRHHFYAQSALVKSVPAPVDSQRTMIQLDQEMQKLFSMAREISDDGTMDESYENSSADAITIIESHSCAVQLATNPPDELKAMASDDKLRAACRELLHSFFSNSAMVNLALTELLANQAACPIITLNGWFWSTPHSPLSNTEAGLTIIQIFEELVNQVRIWKAEISEWDTLIAAQKVNLSDELAAEMPMASSTQKPVDIPNTSQDGSQRQSLDLSDKMMDAYAQSITPRGRKPLNIQRIEARASSAGTSASPSPAPRSPRFPTQRGNQFGSPLRESVASRSIPSASTTRRSSPAASATPDAFRQRIVLPTGGDDGNQGQAAKLPAIERLRLRSENLASSGEPTASSFSPGTTGTTTPSEEQDDGKSVTLGHIITNVIILQEFILEMAAIAHVRTCFYGEIKFR